MCSAGRDLVTKAEEVFAGPKQGERKATYVYDAFVKLWPTLKPHIIQLLTALALQLLKKGVKLA